MKKIINFYKSCGFTEAEAIKEAETAIRRAQWDGVEMCSREFAIEMILADIEEF